MLHKCTVLFAILFLPIAQVHAQEKDLKTIVKLGKAATALVQTESHYSGTAFCISPSGLFVTNQHVVDGLNEGDTATLVLNAAEKTEKVLSAKIVRLDTKADLALLQVKGKKFPFLKLGDANDLFETNQVIAFGFPFGKMLSKREEYPSVTVSTGRITALRKIDGKLNKIQLDNSLHHGNSGGAVLDSGGKVIGIVQAGVRGTRVNVAIPVSQLSRIIQVPVIRFESQTLDENASRSEQTFTIDVNSFSKTQANRRVDLEIRLGDAKPRLFETTRDKSGAYLAKAVLVPNEPAPEMLQVEMQFEGGSIVGRTPDIEVNIGNEKMRLARLSRISFNEGNPKIVLDGKEVSQRVVFPKKAKIDFGSATIKFDFSKAKVITISPIPSQLPQLNYRIVVRDGDKIVAEKSGQFEIEKSKGSVKLTPPRLDKDLTTVKLPAPIDHVVVGGGGRLLIFHLKKLQQLAIYDVGLAKVVKYLPLASNDVTYAAGLEKLFVGLRDIRVIQRYDLQSLEREITVDAPDGGISSLAMGAEATTPLFLLASRSAKKSYLIDTSTMKAEPFLWRGWKGGAWGPISVHVSQDGSSAVACGGGWAGTEVVSIVNGKVVASKTGGYVHGDTLISGNGSLTFPNERGIVRSDLVSAVKGIEGTPFPAISRSYSLAFTKHDKKPALTIFGNNDPKRVATIRDLPELGANSSLPIHHRVFLIPRAKVLITVGESSDRLLLRPFDLEQALEKEGIDYLFIESAPSLQAKLGALYEYSIQVRSRSGGVKYSLQAGPEGMSISKSGRLSWSVPKDYIGKESPVIVLVSDKSGQETFHTFRLKIVE